MGWMAADLAIVGARVRTLDPERPFARAVAVRGGTIVAVGEDVRAACDARTHVIDAGGAALIPGLVDAHIHPFWGAEVARGVDLRGCGSPAEALERLRAAEPQRGWLFAWGLDYDVAPTAAQIGEACGGAAVFVRLADLHTALASPRALQLAHVTGAQEYVVTDEQGVPTGELRETAGDLVLRAAPKLRWPQLRARHAEVLRELNALGLTGGHMMDGDLGTLEMLRELEGSDELTMRLRHPFWITPETSDEQLEHLLTLRDVRGRLWRGGVVKFFADGVIDAGTAWLEAPDTHGESLTPFWPDPERMATVMKRFADAGFQLATHTIGDAAARFTLGAYLRAGAAPGVRHRLEHLEAIPDDLVHSIPRAGVVASMQPVHVNAIRADGTGVWNERLGPERAARAFRMRDLLDAGAVVALGSDWPVADADPRRGLAAAQLREVVPAQRLTAEEALAGYTTAPALVAGDEGTGRIREGMRADLTGLVYDPVDLPAADLPRNPVWLTVVGGRVVHRLRGG